MEHGKKMHSKKEMAEGTTDRRNGDRKSSDQEEVQNDETLPVAAVPENRADEKRESRRKNETPWMYQTGKEIYNFFSRVKSKFTGITVYALVGKSGTGKSFRAKLLGEKLGVEYIIDDGLLIFGDTILAGRSAKRAKGYIEAIKIALFSEDSHRDAICAAIKQHKIKKLLVLGTSPRMVAKLAARLELPTISEIIKIEDIASQEDIEAAIRSRTEQGRHVIPVPSIEIKRDYGTILRDTVHIFFRGDKRKDKKDKQSRIFEKSVVQPEFTDDRKAGRVTITEAALSQMIFHCIDEYDCRIRVKKLKIRILKSGYTVTIELKVPFGVPLGGELEDMRNYICSMIQRYTGIMIRHLELEVTEVIAAKDAGHVKEANLGKEAKVRKDTFRM